MTDFAALPALMSVLGWCLVHFLWQGMVVGLVYGAARMLLPRGNARYVASMSALVLLAALPAATAWREWHIFMPTAATPGTTVVGAPLAAIVVVGPGSHFAWQASLQSMLPWLVMVWALGVGVLGVRVTRQWLALRAMLREAQVLPRWQRRAREFADRMGLRRVVPVLASVRVATPTLIGCLRPAVVLPVAVLTRMPAAQIDFILAHELAHLRRFDHIANLFQVVLETLFYYHPVVHWISRDARNERELCCDAMALRASGGGRRDFLAALAELEELRCAHTEVALAASGGVLVERAWFITGNAAALHPKLHVRSSVLGTSALLLVVMVASLVAWRHEVSQRHAAKGATVHQVATRPNVTPKRLSVRVPPLAARPNAATVPAAVDVAEPANHWVPQVAPVEVDSTPVPSVVVPDVRLHLQLAPLADSRAESLQPRLAATPADAPQPIHTVRPVYPASALWAGRQARVVVAFTLDGQGRPQHMQVMGKGDAEFDDAAMRALSAWRFTPPADADRQFVQVFMFALDSGHASDVAAARPCLVRVGTHICRPVSGAPVLPLQ